MGCPNWNANELNKIIKRNGKKIMKTQIRLFEEEVEEAEFLALLSNLSYEKLFVKLVKEELDRKGLTVKNV